jgi:hypothetical protein
MFQSSRSRIFCRIAAWTHTHPTIEKIAAPIVRAKKVSEIAVKAVSELGLLRDGEIPLEPSPHNFGGQTIRIFNVAFKIDE